jgi:MFS family permease
MGWRDRLRLRQPRSGRSRDGDFLRLWAGQTVGELGSQVTLVALPLTAILVLHATAFEVSVLSGVEFVPFLLFGLPVGVWVDRVSSRLVLVATDFARAVSIGSVPLAYAFHALSLVQLYASGFVTGTLTVFFACAYQAYLPSLVDRERLSDATARLEASRSVAQTAGPGVGGALVSLATAPVAVLADAVSFLVSGLLVSSIARREEPKPGSARRELLAELREGIGFVWVSAILRANLFSSGLANLSYGMTWALLLVFAVRALGLHAGVIGLILAVGQSAGVLGAMLANRLARAVGVGPAFISALALAGPAVFLIAAARGDAAIPLLLLGWALWSFASLITSVLGISIRLALVPRGLQGRVVGATRTIIFGVAPIGSFVGGALATAIGVRAALFASAGIALIAFVPLALSPARQLRILPLDPPATPPPKLVAAEASSARA